MKKTIERMLPCLVLALVLLCGGALAAEGTAEPLPTPTDLKWSVDRTGKPRPGCMSWTADLERAGSFEFQVYCDGKEITDGATLESTYQNGSRHSAMFLSYLNETGSSGPLSAGDYTFRVRSVVGYGESKVTSEWSELSGVYHYTAPQAKLKAPSAPRWEGLYPFMTWTPAEDAADVHSYFVHYYYSATSEETPAMFTGTLHMDLEDGMTSNSVFVDDMMERKGAGYYYFTVQAMSGDLDKAINSVESVLSDAIYYDGEKVVGGGMPAQVAASEAKVSGGRISFDVSSKLASSLEGEGVLFAVGFTDGGISDVEYIAKKKGSFDLKGTKAKVFFLEQGTLAPLAKALEVSG